MGNSMPSFSVPCVTRFVKMLVGMYTSHVNIILVSLCCVTIKLSSKIFIVRLTYFQLLHNEVRILMWTNMIASSRLKKGDTIMRSH